MFLPQTFPYKMILSYKTRTIRVMIFGPARQGPQKNPSYLKDMY